MINQLKNCLLTALFLALAVCGQQMFAQTKRAKTVKPKTETTSISLVSEKNLPMSEVWEKGELPAALPIPAGNADEAIAVLAKKIAAKNAESVPALLTALQMSGFFVTGKDGKTLITPTDGKGQGLTVNGWEVASVAKMLGEGKQTTLTEIEKTLRVVPELKNAPVSSLILRGLQANIAGDKNPYLRNWARLIVELGKNSAPGYEISAASEPEKITLDALQNFLIMRRIYGDFYALAEKIKLKTPNSSGEIRQKPARFVNASYLLSEKTENSSELITSLNKVSDAPCQLNGDAPLVLDAVATGLGYGFGALTGFLDGALDGTAAGDALGKYTKVAGIANIILAYAKFLQTYAALETVITLEDAPPLVRTKNAKPGERKKLKAEVRMNVGNWQMYNCLRTAINLAGIDFAVAVDGAVSGAGVQWHLDEGGAGDFYSNGGGITGKEQIVGFTQDGGRIQDGGTSTGTSGTRIGNATYTKTDGDGIARIILEGSPQKNVKAGKITPVMKQAKVSTTIKLKAGDLKSDTVDITGQVLGGVPGLITMPLELLYRLDWISTAFLTVPVKDWEECEGSGWTGSITYTRKQTATNNKTVQRVSGRGVDITSWEMQDVYFALISVTESAEQKGAFVGRAAISSAANSTEKRTSNEMNLCSGKKERQEMRGEFSVVSRTSGSTGNVEVSVGISTNSDGTYRISMKTPAIKGTASGSSSSSYSGQCYPKEGKNTSSPPSEISIGGQSFGTDLQLMDPSDPNHLSGSYSETSFGVTYTIIWDLRKCGTISQTIYPQEESIDKLLFSGRKKAGIIEISKLEDFLSDLFPNATTR